MKKLKLPSLLAVLSYPHKFTKVSCYILILYFGLFLSFQSPSCPSVSTTVWWVWRRKACLLWVQREARRAKGPNLVDLGPETDPELLALVDRLKNLLKELPKPNTTTLRYIARHLRRCKDFRVYRRTLPNSVYSKLIIWLMSLCFQDCRTGRW